MKILFGWFVMFVSLGVIDRATQPLSRQQYITSWLGFICLSFGASLL